MIISQTQSGTHEQRSNVLKRLALKLIDDFEGNSSNKQPIGKLHSIIIIDCTMNNIFTFSCIICLLSFVVSVIDTCEKYCSGNASTLSHKLIGEFEKRKKRKTLNAAKDNEVKKTSLIKNIRKQRRKHDTNDIHEDPKRRKLDNEPTEMTVVCDSGKCDNHTCEIVFRLMGFQLSFT